MNEVWKDIENYHGIYQVSNLGNVRSVDRSVVTGLGSINRYTGKVLSKMISNGYAYVSLSRDGYTKRYSVHRLVASVFLDNISQKSQVNHMNGNKLDNALDNLEWVTPCENINHAVSTGLIIRKKEQYSSMMKPVVLVEKDISFASVSDAVRFLEDAHNISAYDSKISECANGKRKSAYGFTWKYISK